MEHPFALQEKADLDSSSSASPSTSGQSSQHHPKRKESYLDIVTNPTDNYAPSDIKKFRWPSTPSTVLAQGEALDDPLVSSINDSFPARFHQKFEEDQEMVMLRPSETFPPRFQPYDDSKQTLQTSQSLPSLTSLFGSPRPDYFSSSISSPAALSHQSNNIRLPDQLGNGNTWDKEPTKSQSFPTINVRSPQYYPSVGPSGTISGQGTIHALRTTRDVAMTSPPDSPLHPTSSTPLTPMSPMPVSPMSHPSPVQPFAESLPPTRSSLNQDLTSVNHSARFVLLEQPNEIQRKSYKNESRYLLPNPLAICLRSPNDKDTPFPIVGGTVTVKIVNRDGGEIPGQEGILESLGGLSHPLDDEKAASFSLKVLTTSNGGSFRLLFLISYMEQLALVEEKILSNPFIVCSNRKKQLKELKDRLNNPGTPLKDFGKNSHASKK
eukprot:TRINITY_DN8546_c0_g1_i1.p1 TRINITY_DN8546_c0_g1~~TRINITY_DN8546_c0_g1_i1.p1  ORF type:complete len:469 (-),score=61.97 TRINITY_DN8546_c0_g1_i1:94-1404(-)